jgi:uncharacterized protein YxeA
VKVLCDFWDLQVNTDNQILDMDFESVQTLGLVADVDAIKETVSDVTDAANILTESDKNQDNIVSVDFTMPENSEIIYNDSTGVLTIIDENGNEHEVKVESIPAVIADKDGNAYEIDYKENYEDGKDEISITKSETNYSTTAINKLPTYIGYIHSVGESKGFFCNSQNVEKDELILKALKIAQPYTFEGIEKSCSIAVKDSVAIFWYNAQSKDSTVNLTRTRNLDDTFYLKINEKKLNCTKMIYISKESLKADNNYCELILESSQTKKTTIISTFNLTITAAKPEGYYIMQVEKAIQGNPHRIDYYGGGYTIETNYDVPLQVDSILKIKVMQVAGKDTLQASNDKTKWHVDNTNKYTGERFDYKVLEGLHIVKAELEENMTISLDVNPAAIERPDGRIRLDYSALTARNDTVKARQYFNTAFSTTNRRVVRNDLQNFINVAPKEIVIKIVNKPAVGDVLRGGEADDGASTKKHIYDALDLKDITKDGNTIRGARLISTLNFDDRNNIESSTVDGRLNQKTEVLLLHIARLSQQQADTLNAMIQRKAVRSTFLDSIRYEITDDDDIKEWMTFHNDPTINANVNLNDGFGSKISQNEFIRLTAHELLHHWWTHFRRFDKLKWKVIRDLKESKGYDLSDELNNNGACSAGPGHERYNPENTKVCTEQNNY